jgi:ABC-type multidrug transport system ATPase subunit
MPVVSHADIVAPIATLLPCACVVLADIDLDLVPGEIAAITGGDGSGKSTLLRILVGVSRPSSGTVVDRPREIGCVPERFRPMSG